MNENDDRGHTYKFTFVMAIVSFASFLAGVIFLLLVSTD
jgi:hypothetical protein